MGGVEHRRRNRVRPDGQLIDVPDRGMFWGNRGQLLDRDGHLARHSRGRKWILCRLRFRGRRRIQWQPGRLTELYFLDEPTRSPPDTGPAGSAPRRLPGLQGRKVPGASR